MPFSLSVRAEEDIVSIAEEGICAFGSLVAKRYHEELFAVLELIAENPRMAGPLRERAPFLQVAAGR
jgi:toxin ParE1/3/4